MTFTTILIPYEVGASPLSQKQIQPSFKELFAENRVEALYELNSLKNDQHVVEAISKGEIKVKKFDYDGKKYKVSDAIVLLQNITRDISGCRLSSGDSLLLSTARGCSGKRSEFDEKYEDLVAV
ncbi:hypothetical protein [Sphingobacterium sp. UBA5996]|uniref:hypothetical protein n=1 Tax=Sphingobacterium sp. UBA5996 TaxID=1947505 RepID=UPI0025E31E56|nr:hypothetical protein [Sphingobacterium sp. UBA5996]